MIIDPQKQTQKITEFLKENFKTQGFKQAIVAVSGGIDSAVCLSLAVQALGNQNVYSLQLPYKRQSVELSDLIINRQSLPVNHRLHINIGRPVDQLAVKLNARQDPVRLGNIIARFRMTCLFDQAKKLNCLVIGTENKSENLLGYYTRFGDQASDIDPLSHLYKLQVIELAKYLLLPASIINQPPSAGLWSGQTDEQELGFSYQQADPVLNLLVDQKLSFSQIVAKGFDQKLAKKITARLSAVDFKQKVPYHL